MENTRPRLSPVRFGLFEVDLDAAELRRQGLKIKLQDQPFQVLVMLLERPGEVVARGELQKRLWPADTFVDFDRGLNRAVNKLRETLGDRSGSPRFIETMPRRGYRFIAPVEISGAPVPLTGADGSQPGKTFQKPALLALLAAVFAVAVILLLSLGWIPGGMHLLGPRVQPRIESLAVMPLQNLSIDPAQDYFADGMTDGLITEVARIGSLRVISRTSIMRYKGVRKPLSVIAKELGVDAVVEGTIAYSSGKVRITAQLIRAFDDRHLWSEKYERDLGDALKLQGEVAQAIAAQVKIKLTLPQQERLLRERHVDPRAYAAYVEGSYFGSKVSGDSLTKSVALFTQAIEIDPAYADGYAGLSHAYYVIGMLGLRPAGEAYPKAKAAAEKALELDTTVAEAYNTLAEVKKGYEWDWSGAEVEFKRALELNPSYSLAHAGYAGLLSNLGRHQDAVAHAWRARELDPVSVSANTAMGRILFRARRYDESIIACQKALEFDPNNASAFWWMALSHEQKREFPEAIAELEKAVIFSGEGTLSRGLLANAYALAGDTGKASVVLGELKEMSKKKYVSPVDLAIVYTGLGDRDAAFQWLERAYQEHAMRIQELPDATFDSLRADARFRDLVRRIGLPQ
jgi:TolB-like protein/DNA-binding winged helix-turn-helix (wHTH) protein/Flp pilus assembly protein TadD